MACKTSFLVWRATRFLDAEVVVMRSFLDFLYIFYFFCVCTLLLYFSSVLYVEFYNHGFSFISVVRICSSCFAYLTTVFVHVAE